MKNRTVDTPACQSHFDKQNSILMVMPSAFHLGWMGSTRRVLSVAGAFRALGFNVSLLAGKMTSIQEQATIDREFPGEVIRTDHTGAYPRVLDMAANPRRVCRAFWKARSAEHYASQLSYGWASVLDVDSVVSTLEQRGFRPSLIWGICAGRLEGATAADRLAERFQVPWVFELHDPPIGCGITPERDAIRVEFARLLQVSDRQVVLSESYRKLLIDTFALEPTKVNTIHITCENGILKSGAGNSEGCWRLVYAGSLDGGRSIVPVIKALKIACALAPAEMKNTTQFDLIGCGAGFAEAQRISNYLGLGKNVKLQGFLKGSDVFEYIERASALVVVVSNKATYQVPGKLFESMEAGKPIIALMPDCEANDILRQSGLGFIHTCEDDVDIDNIADTLVKLWTDWRMGRSSVEMDKDYVAQFSVQYLPHKLRIVLDELI